MIGPAHYQAAERCLSSVDDDSAASLALLAEAQVHATLALAAATALASHDTWDSPDHQAWHAVASLTDPQDEVTP
jgi:hypothetical protein